MKSRMIRVLLVFMLSTSLTACTGSTSSSNPNNTGNNGGGQTETASPTSSPSQSPSPSPSPDPTVEPSETSTPAAIPSELEAYKAVLLNDAEFFSVDNNKSLTLNDFLTNKELYATVFKATRFTVLDMDGDQVPEIVLELSVNDYPEFYEILHYADNTVYGYNIVYRGLEALKADGTYLYSNGAADTGYGRLKFQSTALETEILGYTQSSQSNDTITLSYFIDNKPVTKEQYDSFIKEQDEKAEPVWHEFTQTNVEAELYAKP